MGSVSGRRFPWGKIVVAFVAVVVVVGGTLLAVVVLVTSGVQKQISDGANGLATAGKVQGVGVAMKLGAAVPKSAVGMNGLGVVSVRVPGSVPLQVDGGPAVTVFTGGSAGLARKVGGVVPVGTFWCVAAPVSSGFVAFRSSDENPVGVTVLPVGCK